MARKVRPVQLVPRRWQAFWSLRAPVAEPLDLQEPLAARPARSPLVLLLSELAEALQDVVADSPSRPLSLRARSRPRRRTPRPRRLRVPASPALASRPASSRARSATKTSLWSARASSATTRYVARSVASAYSELELTCRCRSLARLARPRACCLRPSGLAL